MEEDEGMVQSISVPCPAAHSNHTRADYGGAYGTLPCCNPNPPSHGGEHPHVRKVFSHRRLCTYGGRVRVGGDETMGAQVERLIMDVHQVSPVLAEVTCSDSCGGGSGGEYRSRGEGYRGR